MSAQHTRERLCEGSRSAPRRIARPVRRLPSRFGVYRREVYVTHSCRTFGVVQRTPGGASSHAAARIASSVALAFLVSRTEGQSYAFDTPHAHSDPLCRSDWTAGTDRALTDSSSGGNGRDLCLLHRRRRRQLRQRHSNVPKLLLVCRQLGICTHPAPEAEAVIVMRAVTPAFAPDAATTLYGFMNPGERA